MIECPCCGRDWEPDDGECKCGTTREDVQDVYRSCRGEPVAPYMLEVMGLIYGRIATPK